MIREATGPQAVVSCTYLLLLWCPWLPWARASEGPPPVLNSTSHASPSGVYRLKVDPSDLYGRFGARYRLTQNDKEVWSGEKPFTLWEAGVTDGGIVAGYAYTHGWRGWADDQPGYGAFHVVILNPSGGASLHEVIQREASHVLHAPPDPLANGMILHGQNDRLVVRMQAPDSMGPESWRVYRLSTGEFLRKFEPRTLMRDADHRPWVVAARPVPDTPLTVVHWWQSRLWRGRCAYGARFTLIDLAGKPVWTLDLPEDYEVPGNEETRWEIRERLVKHGSILNAASSQFELFLVQEAKRVTFSVTQRNGNKWVVSEVLRADYSLPATEKPEESDIPNKRLNYLDSIDLVADGGTNANRLARIAALTVGPDSRIYVADGRTKSVFVFDIQGSLLRVCKPWPSDFDYRSRASGVTVSHTGDVYLRRKEDPLFGGSIDYIHFSALGDRVGIERPFADQRPREWFFQPGTARYWRVGPNKVYLADTEGTLLRVIDRSADDRWLIGPGPASVAPDGSLAVVAATSDRFERGLVTVNVYTFLGNPVWTIELPPSVGQYPGVAFDGRRLVVAGRKTSIVYDASGAPLYRFTLPDRGEQGAAWQPSIVGAGRELLLYDGLEPKLLRYELP